MFFIVYFFFVCFVRSSLLFRWSFSICRMRNTFSFIFIMNMNICEWWMVIIANNNKQILVTTWSLIRSHYFDVVPFILYVYCYPFSVSSGMTEWICCFVWSMQVFREFKTVIKPIRARTYTHTSHYIFQALNAIWIHIRWWEQWCMFLLGIHALWLPANVDSDGKNKQNVFLISFRRPYLTSVTHSEQHKNVPNTFW